MDLKKKLFSGMFWMLLLNILLKPIWLLGIEVGVQNAVGNEVYGLYFPIFNLSYIFNILLDLGATNFNTRNIAQHPTLIHKYFGGIFSMKVMLLGLYLLVTFSVALILGFDSREFYLLAWLSFNQFLSSMILYLRSNFQGLLMFRFDSVLSVMDRLLMIIICGFLLLKLDAGRFRIEYFVYAQTVAYLLTLAIALGVLARRTDIRRPKNFRLFSLAILKQSFPFALLVLLMATYNRLDPILLRELLPDGAVQSGNYAEAFRLLDALSMVAYLVSIPLLPTFVRLLQDRDFTQTHTVARKVFLLLMLFAVPVAVLCSCFSQEIIQILYHHNVEASAAVFRVIIFCLIPISITYIFGTLLTANGNLRQLNILAALTLLLNILANLVLIPRFQAVGSAFSSLIAQTFMALAQLILSLKIIPRNNPQIHQL